MVAGAGDQRGPAGAGVDHAQGEVEAGEIDGRGQPGRAAADDQAIERVVCHGRTAPRLRRLFRVASAGQALSRADRGGRVRHAEENAAAGRSAARCFRPALAQPRRRLRPPGRSSSCSRHRRPFPALPAESACAGPGLRHRPRRPAPPCRRDGRAGPGGPAAGRCRQPVPDRLDVEGLHGARDIEVARRGPARARRARRNLCPGNAELALSDQ